ncbi:MAG: hypothetical protein EOO00_06875 [Chitinophagaceae bacterium]|nr:MAG: hypothetical protein EOO00_06875 [Chitinophagaceae bacterium]
MLNADEAGEAAAKQHAATLNSLLAGITISKVNFPAGEDVNSLLQSHEDPAILADLIESRVQFFVSAPADTSIENKKRESLPAAVVNHKLNTGNAELLIYDDGELYMEILGGIKITGLDRMKVTLKVRVKEKIQTPQWYSVDLYNQVQREQLISAVSECKYPITVTVYH